MRALLAAAILMVATPVLADETIGTVLSYDAEAQRLILEDDTVWELAGKIETPVDLVAGEKIRIVYRTNGEDGLAQVSEIIKIDG